MKEKREKNDFCHNSCIKLQIDCEGVFFHIMQQNEIKICLMIPFKFQHYYYKYI